MLFVTTHLLCCYKSRTQISIFLKPTVGGWAHIVLHARRKLVIPV